MLSEATVERITGALLLLIVPVTIVMIVTDSGVDTRVDEFRGSLQDVADEQSPKSGAPDEHGPWGALVAMVAVPILAAVFCRRSLSICTLISRTLRSRIPRSSNNASLTKASSAQFPPLRLTICSTVRVL